MNKSQRTTFIIFAITAVLIILYWLLPIDGQLAFVSGDTPQTNTWPLIDYFYNNEGELEVVVQDITPWAFVHLELDGADAILAEHGTQNTAGIWEWTWRIQGQPSSPNLTLYHSCNSGCQLWTTAQTAVSTPSSLPDPKNYPATKLGLVFANPQRNWHDRQGWDIEITYAQLAEEDFWGIDDLAKRVRQAEENGLRVLIRIEYDQGQSIPAPNDITALDTYLRYVERLARDARLANVHGFIIGSNINTAGANSQAGNNPVTPEWYARVFNGYGTNPDIHANAIETIKNENPQANVLVGPISPWNIDQDGNIPYETNAPWLNYMNSVVNYVNESAKERAETGISDIAPDGFAVQAFGRVAAPELATREPAQEPFIDLHREEWGDAQMGFRVYRDWLDIINQYEHTTGKPVYINASNTFDSETSQTPAENYPEGWLTNALTVINQEPQVQMLGWFMDGFAHDEQWAMFSLTTPRGLLVEAAQEFDTLLQEK